MIETIKQSELPIPLESGYPKGRRPVIVELGK
jgi:hypothetical protein